MRDLSRRRLLLVPADPLSARSADEHFSAEARAATAAGLEVAVIDDGALAYGDLKQALKFVPAGDAVALYRGWMLRSEHYAALADALAARDISLATSAAMYRSAHELPGWYEEFRQVTPRAVWSVGTDPPQVEATLAQMEGRVVVKDYVKSLKHDEGALVGDAAHAAEVVRRFLDGRADDLVGGIVLREFEEFTGAEVRSWWVDGQPVLIGAHPDTPDHLPPAELSLTKVAAAVESFGARFCTVDLAKRAGGRWRVIEVGDGQVSDRPRSVPADEFVQALLPLFD